MVAVVRTQDIDFIVHEGVCALQLLLVFLTLTSRCGWRPSGTGHKLVGRRGRGLERLVDL